MKSKIISQRKMNKHPITYQESLDYIYSFVDYSLTRQLRYSPEKFDLVRMKRLMDLMDNPHLKYPTIHVTGTKGKGSICAMVASILKESGLKVGLYTSPHLQEYTERIKVNDEEISKDDFIKILNSMIPIIEKVEDLSTFEITTAMAFQYFLACSVDVAVIEVGLGGRLDATNIVHPIVSIISSISKDHVKILGGTLKKIATEKAGIIKPGVPVVISKQKPHVETLLRNIAIKIGSQPYYVPKTLSYNYLAQNLKGQEIQIMNLDNGSFRIQIPLLGIHQIQNALTAYLAIKIIARDNFTISIQDIQRGFQKVKWPGRFEILSENPMLVIDSAHNTDSMKHLVTSIKNIFPGKQLITIFGASEDKDIKGMLKILLPECKILIASQSTHPRAMTADKICKIASQLNRNAKSIPSIEKALEQAIDQFNEKSIIIVTGSIFMAAAVRELWKSDRWPAKK